jgi:hypothetical protein
MMHQPPLTADSPGSSFPLEGQISSIHELYCIREMESSSSSSSSSCDNIHDERNQRCARADVPALLCVFRVLLL